MKVRGTHADQHTPVEGLEPLLKLLTGKLEAENGIAPGARRVVVTAGGTMGFLNALFAITDPGDEVILPLPCSFNQEEAGSGYCRRQLATLQDVRSVMLDELRGLEGMCDVPPGKGALYVLSRLKQPMDAMTIAERLIREHRVAAIPGHAFGVTDALCSSYGALTQETGEPSDW